MTKDVTAALRQGRMSHGLGNDDRQTALSWPWYGAEVLVDSMFDTHGRWILRGVFSAVTDRDRYGSRDTCC